MVSQGCQLLFRHYFSEFEILISILVKFGSNKSKLTVLTENWHTWYLEDAGSYSNISFMNFRLLIPFWANLDQKSQNCLFCLKAGIHGISRMLTLTQHLFFFKFELKSIFGKIWVKKVKFVHFAWKLAHLVSWGCIFLR